MGSYWKQCLALRVPKTFWGCGPSTKRSLFSVYAIFCLLLLVSGNLISKKQSKSRELDKHLISRPSYSNPGSRCCWFCAFVHIYLSVCSHFCGTNVYCCHNIVLTALVLQYLNVWQKRQEGFIFLKVSEGLFFSPQWGRHGYFLAVGFYDGNCSFHGGRGSRENGMAGKAGSTIETSYSQWHIPQVRHHP